jgi:hypothetical protein
VTASSRVDEAADLVDPAGAADPSGAGDPPAIPFAGLRRHARALLAATLLLAAIGFVVPDLGPPPIQPPAVPLTTAIAVALLDRRLPFISDRERRLAAGWD